MVETYIFKSEGTVSATPLMHLRKITGLEQKSDATDTYLIGEEAEIPHTRIQTAEPGGRAAALSWKQELPLPLTHSPSGFHNQF